ncbi:GntR family transcriptional regulator [Niallia sp. 01092]|uniref:GntR family transcriptional regulator n=1 Tax=unclassified Niallia TaxID=2837522 RepID=UPI003FCF7390
MKDISIEKKSLATIAFKKIVDLIETDVLAIGEKLDAEQKLANKLNISRPVLREALQRLELEGYIVRKHGVGTFVISKSPVLSSGIEKLDSVTELVGAQNYQVGTIAVTKPQLSNDLHIKKQLRMGENEELYVFERIRTADKKPFALDKVYMPERLLMNKTFTGDDDQSILDYLSHVHSIEIFSSQCNMFAENASEEISKKLGVIENEALQVLEQTFYDNANHPVFYGKSYIASNIMKFNLVRRR